MGLLESGHTDAVRIPLGLQVVWVPDVARKVRRTFIHVNELDEFGVEVGVAEGAIRHEGVIEVSRVLRIALQSMKLGEFALVSG